MKGNEAKQRRNEHAPSTFFRTFFTFFLQPSQWIGTLNTHVCKIKIKKTLVGNHKKLQSLKKKKKKKVNRYYLVF